MERMLLSTHKNYYTNIQCVGSYILFRGIENGKRVNKRIKYSPRLFLHSDLADDNKFKTLEGKNLAEVKFDTIYDARGFVERYKGIDNYRIYGNTNYPYAFIADNFPNQIEFDVNKLKIVYIDIEVGSESGFPNVENATEPVIAITISIKGKYLVFGCGEWENKENKENIKYIKCTDEKQLLTKFLTAWNAIQPDIVSGWYINSFDFPYLINRMKRLFMEEEMKLLSPWKKISERKRYFNNKEHQYYVISGVSILDYIDLYMKFSSHPNQESYKLDHIANVELGENKLDYSEYLSLHNLYTRNYQKFIDYNIHDVTLVSMIENKTRLIELAATLAYDNKVNFEDVFSQVRMWDSIIYNHLLKRNIIVPPKNDNKKSSQYEGAYVKDPRVGMCGWGVSFDLDGLYPHLIMMYNISPETLIDFNKQETRDTYPEVYQWYLDNVNSINVESMLKEEIDLSILKKYNMTMTPNGAIFTREFQGFLPKLMEEMYEDRKRYKKKMLENQKKLETATEDKEVLENNITKFNNFQSAKKITLNSAYGTIGNEHFRFFDIRIAEAVTSSGKLSIRWIENKVNDFMIKSVGVDKDYIIASDTDSIYIDFEEFVKKNFKDDDRDIVCDKINSYCNDVIQKYIDKSYKELDSYVNAFAHKMNMKREAIFTRGVWTAKKRYLLNVLDNEGVKYSKAKVKIKGMEGIKSSTPTIIRDKMKEAYGIILNESESDLIKFVDKFRKEFQSYPIQDISFPRSCNGIDKYSDSNSIWKKGTPIHVKGAIAYNHLLKKLSLEKKYEKIKEGDKVRYFYLKEPNPIGCNCISFPLILPDEFELKSYLDYNIQLDKVFVDPLKIILDAINWKVENRANLSKFF